MIKAHTSAALTRRARRGTPETAGNRHSAGNRRSAGIAVIGIVRPIITPVVGYPDSPVIRMNCGQAPSCVNAGVPDGPCMHRSLGPRLVNRCFGLALEPSRRKVRFFILRFRGNECPASDEGRQKPHFQPCTHYNLNFPLLNSRQADTLWSSTFLIAYRTIVIECLMS